MAKLEAWLDVWRTKPGWPQCYDRQNDTYRCNGSNCKRNRRVLGKTYPTCPERWRMGGRWQHILRLYTLSQIAPLSGWPDKHLAWVTRGMRALSCAIAERTAEAAKR